jgi:hypothetical protein
LQDNNRELRASVAHFDYESGAVLAFSSVFGDVLPKVCVFHAQQALLRRVQKIGLQRLYRSKKKPVVRLLLMLGGLQLVHESWYADLKFFILMWIGQVVEEEGEKEDDEWVPIGTKGKLKSLVEYYL